MLSGVPGGARVELVGYKELRRTLKAAGEDLSQLTDLNREIGRIILPTAQSSSPIGPGPKHLRDTVRVGATQKTAIIRAGNNTTVPYANPIHWGWVRRHIMPNPFISLAAQATEPRWFQQWYEHLDKILRKVKGIS